MFENVQRTDTAADAMARADAGGPVPLSFFVEPADSAAFSTHRIGPLRHNFHLHPLLQLDALEKLAHYLAERKQCRFVSPDIKLNSAFAHDSVSPDGRTLSEVFANMAAPRSWIALYNVEAHPEYRLLLEQIIDSVREVVRKEQAGIFNVGGFIFISAPPAVTPFHIDRENNFWLQLRGQKNLTVFDHTDRDIVSAKAVERFIVGHSLDDVKLRDEIAHKGQRFVTRPGDGVYFPSTTPHMTTTTDEWISSDNGVSISIGVVFYTDHTRRQAQVHQCNAVLRRLGMTPKPPGQSKWLDGFKAQAGRFLAAAKVRFRGYNAPPGSY